MKKVLVMCVALIAISTTILAQKSTKDIRIGFLLEPSINWLHPVENGVKNDGSKFGISYGFMIDYEFSKNYFISSGLQVSASGGNLSYTGNIWPDKHVGYFAADSTPNVASTANYKLAIQYLQLPFTLKLRSDEKNKFAYWGSFGAFLAVPLKARLNAQSNFAVNGTANYAVDNENIIGKVQPINIGMQIGVGVEYAITTKNTLVAGLLFNNGFIDVTKNGNWGDDGRINLNNFALKLGMFF